MERQKRYFDPHNTDWPEVVELNCEDEPNRRQRISFSFPDWSVTFDRVTLPLGPQDSDAWNGATEAMSFRGTVTWGRILDVDSTSGASTQPSTFHGTPRGRHATPRDTMWLMLLNFPNGVGGYANIAKVEVVSSNLISRSRSRPLGVGSFR